MIKKYIKNLLTFGIIWLWIINFSHGAWNWMVYSWILFAWDCLTSNWSDICIDEKLNIYNTDWYDFWKINLWWRWDRYLFWKNWKIYYWQAKNQWYQWFFSWYSVTDDISDVIPQFNSPLSEFYWWNLWNRFSKTYLNFVNNWISIRLCSFSTSINEYVCYWNRTIWYWDWDLQLDLNWLTYSEINTLVQPEKSPFNSSQNWWWWNWWITINRNQWKYYCPTFREVLQNYWNKYNTWLCYNSTLRYDWNQITTETKQDIFTVFTDYTEYTNRISIYRNNCGSTSTQANCSNAFTGERKKYSIIANAINNNVDEKKLWNYCNIGLNYDLSQTTCTASWYIAEQPTAEEILEDILHWNYTISTPPQSTWWTGGNILNDLINWNINTWTIVGSWTREDIATRDIFGQLDQIKSKISDIFESRSWVSGIIPDYILWLILTILLLTVLIKK